jgi:hypothetical protein
MCRYFFLILWFFLVVIILFLSNMIIRSFLCKIHDKIQTIQNLKLKSDCKVDLYLQHFSIISLYLIRFLNNTCLIMNYSNYLNLDIFTNMCCLQYHYSFKEWCLHIEFLWQHFEISYSRNVNNDVTIEVYITINDKYMKISK